MKITRKSLISGEERTRDLSISEDQLAAYNAGKLVQDAFPQLSDSDREFFVSGITDEEWDQAFPEDEEDDFDFEEDEPAF